LHLRSVLAQACTGMKVPVLVVGTHTDLADAEDQAWLAGLQLKHDARVYPHLAIAEPWSRVDARRPSSADMQTLHQRIASCAASLLASLAPMPRVVEDVRAVVERWRAAGGPEHGPGPGALGWFPTLQDVCRRARAEVELVRLWPDTGAVAEVSLMCGPYDVWQ